MPLHAGSLEALRVTRPEAVGLELTNPRRCDGGNRNLMRKAHLAPLHLIDRLQEFFPDITL